MNQDGKDADGVAIDGGLDDSLHIAQEQARLLTAHLANTLSAYDDVAFPPPSPLESPPPSPSSPSTSSPISSPSSPPSPLPLSLLPPPPPFHVDRRPSFGQKTAGTIDGIPQPPTVRTAASKPERLQLNVLNSSSSSSSNGSSSSNISSVAAKFPPPSPVPAPPLAKYQQVKKGPVPVPVPPRTPPRGRPNFRPYQPSRKSSKSPYRSQPPPTTQHHQQQFPPPKRPSNDNVAKSTPTPAPLYPNPTSCPTPTNSSKINTPNANSNHKSNNTKTKAKAKTQTQATETNLPTPVDKQIKISEIECHYIALALGKLRQHSGEWFFLYHKLLEAEKTLHSLKKLAESEKKLEHLRERLADRQRHGHGQQGQGLEQEREHRRQHQLGGGNKNNKEQDEHAEGNDYFGKREKLLSRRHSFTNVASSLSDHTFEMSYNDVRDGAKDADYDGDYYDDTDDSSSLDNYHGVPDDNNDTDDECPSLENNIVNTLRGNNSGSSAFNTVNNIINNSSYTITTNNNIINSSNNNDTTYTMRSSDGNGNSNNNKDLPTIPSLDSVDDDSRSHDTGASSLDVSNTDSDKAVMPSPPNCFGRARFKMMSTADGKIVAVPQTDNNAHDHHPYRPSSTLTDEDDDDDDETVTKSTHSNILDTSHPDSDISSSILPFPVGKNLNDSDDNIKFKNFFGHAGLRDFSNKRPQIGDIHKKSTTTGRPSFRKKSSTCTTTSVSSMDSKSIYSNPFDENYDNGLDTMSTTRWYRQQERKRKWKKAFMIIVPLSLVAVIGSMSHFFKRNKSQESAIVEQQGALSQSTPSSSTSSTSTTSLSVHNRVDPTPEAACALFSVQLIVDQFGNETRWELLQSDTVEANVELKEAVEEQAPTVPSDKEVISVETVSATPDNARGDQETRRLLRSRRISSMQEAQVQQDQDASSEAKTKKVVILSGGPYSYQHEFDREATGDEYKLVEAGICLPVGFYKFVIHDDMGDGICCYYGHGKYGLHFTDGREVRPLSSGNFLGGSEETIFEVTSDDLNAVAPDKTGPQNGEVVADDANSAPEAGSTSFLSFSTASGIALTSEVSKTYGILFNVEMDPEASSISISGMDLYLDTTFMVHYEVWVKPGSWQNVDGANPDYSQDFHRISHGTILGKGLCNEEAMKSCDFAKIPIQDFNDIVLARGGTRRAAIYVTLESDDLIVQNYGGEEANGNDMSNNFLQTSNAAFQVFYGASVHTYPLQSADPETDLHRNKGFLGRFWYKDTSNV